MMCYMPPQTIRTDGAVVLVVLCFSVVLLLGAVWARRIYGQKSARLTSSTHPIRGLRRKGLFCCSLPHYMHYHRHS